MKSPKSFGKPKKPKLLTVRRVVGESMMPTLRPGALVIAIPAHRLRPKDIVIVTHNGLEKIKRIERIENAQVFVVGDNPAHSTDSRMFGWLDQVAVTARVIWPRR
jgi:phage repressor protein C with HTH and peptisase S24 domain